MPTFDMTALAASVGNVFRSEKDQIIIAMMKKLKTLQYVKLIVTDRKKSLTKIKKNKPVLSGGKSTVLIPTGTDDAFVLSERTINPQHGNINLYLDPGDWYDNYLTEKEERKWSGITEAFTFEHFLINQVFLPAYHDDIEDLLWNGTGDPADTIVNRQICKGFLTVIADLITALQLTPTAISTSVIGPFSQANAVDYLREMYMAMPVLYRSLPLYLYCSQDTIDNYCIDYQKSIGSVVYNTQFGQPKLDIGNVTLRPIDALATSKRKVLTPDGNLTLGVGSLKDLNELKTFAFPRQILVHGDSRFDTNFADTDCLIVNDEA